jgi:hypothetical protein
MKSIINRQQHNIPHSRANASSVQVNEGVERCRTESTSSTKMITNHQQVSELTYHSAHQIIGQSDIGEVFTPFAVSGPISSLIQQRPTTNILRPCWHHVAMQPTNAIDYLLPKPQATYSPS